VPPTGYLNTAAIEACVQFIAANFPAIATLIPLHEHSVEGRAIHAVKIASGGGANRRGALLIAGVHAREIVNPDALVTLALKLCQAYTNGTGLSFGGKNYSAEQIALIVDALDVVMLPLVNPDGRTYVQSPAGQAMWRKNRALNLGQPCRGVDLNRNFDFLWSSGIGTSSSSCSDVFKGPSAFSEAETRNVRHLLDDYPNIGYFIDVHSYSELVLYPWGDDDNQTSDPSQNFQNPVYNGQRGIVGAGYGEYIPGFDLDWYLITGARIRDAIAAVRGRTYTLQQSIGLYPTSGTSDDYAYSRTFVDSQKRKVRGFTLETGREFQPVPTEGQQIIDEVSAGLVEFLQAALCAVEQAARLTDQTRSLTGLRRVRDRASTSSGAARRYLEMAERHSGELASLLATDEALLTAVGAALQQLSSLVSSPDKTLDQKLAGILDELGTRLAALASDALREDIETVQRELPELTGRTLDQIVGDSPEAAKPPAAKGRRNTR